MGQGNSKGGTKSMDLENGIYARVIKSKGTGALESVNMWEKKYNFPPKGTLSVKALTLLREKIIADGREMRAQSKINTKDELVQTKSELNIKEWLEVALQNQKKQEKENKAQCLPASDCLQDETNSLFFPPPYAPVRTPPGVHFQCTRVPLLDDDLQPPPQRRPPPPPAPPVQQPPQVQQPARQPPPSAPPQMQEQPHGAGSEIIDLDTTVEEDEGEPQIKKEPGAIPKVKGERQIVTRGTAKISLQAPMIQVAGPEGQPMLVYRPYGWQEIQEMGGHFSPVEVGGTVMAEELIQFCRTYSPRIQEVKKILEKRHGFRLGTKMTGKWPDDSAPTHPDWNHDSNLPYRNAVEQIAKALKDIYPVTVNTQRLTQTKQKPDEPVEEYLNRLTTVFEQCSGMLKPEGVNINTGDVTSWESYLKQMFLGGLQPDISAKVKQTCIGWESGKLGEVVTHSLHAERLLDEDKRKKQRKADQQLSSAFAKIGEWTQPQQTQRNFSSQGQRFRDNGQQKEKEKRRGKQWPEDPKEKICWYCGKKGHLKSQCFHFLKTQGTEDFQAGAGNLPACKEKGD
ncbi:uncharacterized protein [Misgurnus anguillicaudatus]|uniref:uncharacterized protein n=1 Tax=Misgurnus anguillicaudatus TaxID=75329 RepID=UPI003CCFAA6C